MLLTADPLASKVCVAENRAEKVSDFLFMLDTLYLCRMVHLGFCDDIRTASSCSQHEAGVDCEIHSKGW